MQFSPRSCLNFAARCTRRLLHLRPSAGQRPRAVGRVGQVTQVGLEEAFVRRQESAHVLAWFVCWACARFGRVALPARRYLDEHVFSAGRRFRVGWLSDGVTEEVRVRVFNAWRE